jgi:hypothetical protein
VSNKPDLRNASGPAERQRGPAGRRCIVPHRQYQCPRATRGPTASTRVALRKCRQSPLVSAAAFVPRSDNASERRHKGESCSARRLFRAKRHIAGGCLEACKALRAGGAASPECIHAQLSAPDVPFPRVSRPRGLHVARRRETLRCPRAAKPRPPRFRQPTWPVYCILSDCGVRSRNDRLHNCAKEQRAIIEAFVSPRSSFGPLPRPTSTSVSLGVRPLDPHRTGVRCIV